MEGKELLSSIYNNYVSLPYYQDVGKITVGTNSREFKTYFKKPNKFRYEWSDVNLWADSQRTILRESSESGTAFIISNGDGTYFQPVTDSELILITSKMELDRILQRKPPLALYVLNMLVPREKFDPEILYIQQPIICDSQDLDGIDCTILSGNLFDKSDVEIWVDQSLLVRRVRLKLWFRELQRKGINDDSCKLDQLAFSHDCIYSDVLLSDVPDFIFEPI